MCGIYGVIAKKNSSYSYEFILKIVLNLAMLSESRGKESAGLAYYDFVNKDINVLKGPVPSSEMIKGPIFKSHLKILKSHFLDKSNTLPIAVMGHSRLVTDGSFLHDENNQPTIKNGIVSIHNGIFTNHKTVWDKHQNLNREFEIDTEIFNSLLKSYIENGNSIQQSVSNIFSELEGTASISSFFDNKPEVLLTTNNG
jgi:glucosamine--fructose-6-phosphate aminotransferase (isomerizing)